MITSNFRNKFEVKQHNSGNPLTARSKSNIQQVIEVKQNEAIHIETNHRRKSCKNRNTECNA